MNMQHNNSQDEVAAAVRLGKVVRAARKQKGCSLAALADKIGRPREWLNRLELGYSQYGEFKPPSSSDLQSIMNVLEDCFAVPEAEVLELGRTAEQEYQQFKRQKRSNGRQQMGKLTQTEVILGEQQIVRAITNLIEEQYSDAIIRNTGVKGAGGYLGVNADWKTYRHALGNFLQKNPNALFKRLEFAATPQHIKEAKDADAKLAGTRDIKDVHNAKIKFKKYNPLQVHVVIGQREAILALPHVSGKAGSNAALLIRDKVFVEALRTWYDEVLWDGEGESKMLDFSRFDESFEEIKDMYKFD